MRQIRRKEKSIQNREEMIKVLQKTKYITLALCKNNLPYIATLSHGYDAENNVIYFHCASEGKKIDYIQENNNIWGQALLDFGYSLGECDHKYATVQFSGHIEFLHDIKEKEEALKVMIKQLEKDPHLVIRKQLSSPKAIQNVTIGKIIISYLSGKKHQSVQL